jgi:transposase InsO family protein
MDFVSDALFDGRRIRALTVIDNHTRESLAIEVGQGITGEQVVGVMNRISAARGVPPNHSSRQWARIRFARAGSMSIPKSGHLGLQPPRQTDRQRRGGIIQWTPARRVFEH